MLLFCWGTLGFRCQVRLKTLSPSSVSNQHPQGGKKPLGVSEFPRGRKGWPQREQPMSLRFLAKSKTINFESTVTAWIYAPGRFQVSSKTILQRRGKTTSFPIVVSQHERESLGSSETSLSHCYISHAFWSTRCHQSTTEPRASREKPHKGHVLLMKGTKYNNIAQLAKDHN